MISMLPLRRQWPGIGLLVWLVLSPVATTTAGELLAQTEITKAVVRISSPSTTGTGFLLAQPAAAPDQPPAWVLVTANHVFERTDAPEVTLGYRKREKEGGYSRLVVPLTIRAEQQPAWKRHPKQDIAAIKITPPAEADLPASTTAWLASDADVGHLEPGDLVRVVGYPHGNVFEPSPAGFPTTRLGCLASFPLTRTPTEPTFLVDCTIFEGVSGGPVYSIVRDKEGHERVRVLGLVHGQHWFNQRSDNVYEAFEFRRQLGLAVIEHAASIREVVDLVLPPN